MTDVDFDDYYESDTEALVGSVATLMNWTGAVLSMVLIGGLGYWGYTLLVRDVAGVPVVRAIEGPMRIAPVDPGGAQAEYQGLSVTRVAVEGAAEAPTEQVVLAPAQVNLEEEDLPVAALIPSDPLEDSTLASGGAVGLPSAETGGGEAPVASAIEMALAEALGEEIAQENGAQVVLASASGASLVPPSVRGVAVSPRPMIRPASLVQTVSVRSVSSVPTASTLDLGPGDIAPGARLVQLGAFPTPEAAHEAWDKLGAQFADYFGDKQRLVQEAKAGGKTFYRLRAVGYEDLSDARRFCAVLVAGSANCIPVIHR
ncbi:MAG: SPOR domain-containing protein [Rhodobacteraceae bacterium]|nr:SPOR domain-containing protein [Paracoccaceae bacterium]